MLSSRLEAQSCAGCSIPHEPKKISLQRVIHDPKANIVAAQTAQRSKACQDRKPPFSMWVMEWIFIVFFLAILKFCKSLAGTGLSIEASAGTGLGDSWTSR